MKQMDDMYLRDEPKPKQVYTLHCDCGFHQTTDGTDFKLVEIKQAPVPRGLPQLNNGKIEVKDAAPRSKKFKCPKCGRGVTARKSNVPKISHLTENKDEEKNQPPRRKASSFGRTLSPDFTG